MMVWWGIPYTGATEIHFCKHGAKTSAKVYLEMLKNVVKPLNGTIFQNKPCVFQQDSAPGHKVKYMQTWLKDNFPAFIRAENWSSGCPDLNTLDYRMWQLLEEKACAKLHNTAQCSIEHWQVQTSTGST